MKVARSRTGNHDRSGVLWIHGYTIDSTTWEELWALLPEWPHYGVDLPGHGESPPLKPGMTLREVGLQFAEVAIEHGCEHVVGLSFGSMIALEVAISRPDAFETLTLAAPALGGGPVAPDVGKRYRELTELYERRGPGPWMTELWMRSPPATFAHASESLRTRLAGVIDGHTWVELQRPEAGFGALVRQPQDLRPFPLVKARPLVVIGEHELPAFRQTAIIFGRIRPDASVVELPGAGHLCLLHDPIAAARLLRGHWSDVKRRSKPD